MGNLINREDIKMERKITHCWGGKVDNIYKYFSDAPFKIRMDHGIVNEDIDRVVIKEILPGETSTYFAWWDARDNQFNFVYESKEAAEECFPNGSKIEEDNGNGKLCKVTVEEFHRFN